MSGSISGYLENNCAYDILHSTSYPTSHSRTQEMPVLENIHSGIRALRKLCPIETIVSARS